MIATRKARRPLRVVIHQVGTPQEREAAWAKIEGIINAAWEQHQAKQERATA